MVDPGAVRDPGVAGKSSGVQVAGLGGGTLERGRMDEHSLTYWQDPQSADLLRQHSSVHWVRMPRLGFVVAVVLRHEEATAVLEDKDQCLGKDRDTLLAIMERKTVEAGGEFVVPAALATPHMLFADGPDHGRMRRIVAPAFDTHVGAARQTGLHDVVAEVIAGLDVTAPVDILADFAAPLSMKVIGGLVGVPEQDHAQVAMWSAAIVRDDPVTAPAASSALTEYLTRLVEAKRERPGDDLIRDLLSHGKYGLSSEEIVATLILLLVPGHESTAALIGNATARLLADSRSAWRAMAEDPSVVPAAVNEMLRSVGSSRHTSFRYTKKQLTVGDTVIHRGNIVLVSINSANRDQSVRGGATPCLHRAARDDLAFGRGAHECFGAELATLIIESAFAQLPRSFPDARLGVDPENLVPIIDPIMMTFATVPVVLQP